MARFSGKIGYVEYSETSPGVWTSPNIIERQYYGDLIKRSLKWGPSDGANSNIKLRQDISVVADPYMYGHLQNMRYVIFQGIKWSITDFEVDRPRVRISIGEEYHGDEA